MAYFRPLAQAGQSRPAGAVPLAGGPAWFVHAERLERGAPPEIVAAENVPDGLLRRLSEPRAPLCGLDLSEPAVMGILNVTPDSFSDGGRHDEPERALSHARLMRDSGAGIVDIGGESTRPGAAEVPERDELARTIPVIQALRGENLGPISIDTRKSAVAKAALRAGASMVNDVSGLEFDPDMARTVVESGAPVCVMHSSGLPESMQKSPRYDDVLLDVYDFLESRVRKLENLGHARDSIVVDPGIGFGKTRDHNLALLRGIALLHGIGCAILLGVSRKRFLGEIGNAPDPARRAPGSIAAGLASLAQGVQLLRVHDVAETVQAIRVWQAAR